MSTTKPEDREAALELYERAPCALLVMAAGGTILRVNRTFSSWLGYAPDEVVGRRRLQDLLTMGSKIFHQTHWMPLLQIQGSVAEVQLDLVHRDGHALPMLVNAVQHIVAGQTHYELALFVAADRRTYERELLHARKQAEQLLERERAAQRALSLAEAQLRLALDSAELVVWSVDLATGRSTYDPGVQRLLRQPEGMSIDHSVYRARLHPEDQAAEQAAMQAALDTTGTGHYAIEYRLIGFDGVQRVIRSSGRALFDAQGRMSGFAGVLQDVTDWRLAEKLLREQGQEAQARALLAEQLVGIVSHDLRTPLNAVQLGASMLAANQPSSAQARLVDRIASAAKRANRLIEDLLDFTQARIGGGLRLVLNEVDPHALVAECVEELRLAWPGRMLEHRALGVGTCALDAGRIAQVVTNLANNAMTYGSPERPVTLRTRLEAHGLGIEVHNHGPAIPEQLLPHIFEPMRRGEQQIRLGSRSVGLGLYIVQQIAASHGGSVEVQSNATDGTTFRVQLPLECASHSA